MRQGTKQWLSIIHLWPSAGSIHSSSLVTQWRAADGGFGGFWSTRSALEGCHALMQPVRSFLLECGVEPTQQSGR